MSRAALSHPAARLSAFYAAIFLVAGIQLPFWPIWLAARGLTAREIGIVLAAAIWAKVLATPVIGAIADRSGTRRAVMAALAATALASYAALSSAASFWVLISLNLVALTTQSALMPLGDTVSLADIYLVTGAIMLTLYSFVTPQRKDASAAPPAAPVTHDPPAEPAAGSSPPSSPA